MRFAAVYGLGAAVGYTPQDVDRMSIWQFRAAVDGWLDANGAREGGSTLSESEKDEIWDWMQQQTPVPASKWVH